MRERLLPLLLLLSLVSTCAEVDISIPGFPQIAAFYHVSEAMIQATITINFLGYFLGGRLYGPLSDVFGRRQMMLFGNAVMSVGAIGCVLAPTAEILLASRFIQGLGASTSVVLVFTMIADLYQGEKAMKLIGMMNAALSIIMAFAPILGGLINKAIGWRGNYASVAIFSIFVWFLLLLYLPESIKTKHKWQLKRVSDNYGKLLHSARFWIASMIPSLLFSSYMAYIAASSFLYQMTYGLSTLGFVLHQAIIVASFSITSLYAQPIITKFGPRNAVRNGVALAALSIFILIILSAEHVTSPYVMTFFMSLFSIGFAAAYPVVFQDSLMALPELQGSASSMIMSIRALLVTCSTAVTGMVYSGSQLSLVLSVAIGVGLSTLFSLSWLARNKATSSESVV